MQDNQSETSRAKVMPAKFENCGTAELASTGRSIRVHYEPECSVFVSSFYISVKDLEALVSGKKKSITLFRKIEAEEDQKENQIYGK